MSNVEIQYHMKMLGFSVGMPDGKPCRQSRVAVSDFQLVYGLSVDGQVGRQALQTAVTTTRSAIREMLKGLGFGASDGTEVPLENSVKDSQRPVDLPRDGLISVQVLESLEKARGQAIRSLDPWHDDVPASRR